MLANVFLAATWLILTPPRGYPPELHCNWSSEHRIPDARPIRLVEGNLLSGAADLIALRAVSAQALIVVDQGNFRNADLRGAQLSDICFVGSDLSGSDWRGAEGAGLVFAGADLSGARLAGARLPGATFRNATLDDVDATGAMLQNAQIIGGPFLTMERLRLDRANLRGFRFECGITEENRCSLQTEMSMRGADLTDAALDDIWFDPDWSGARVDRTKVRPAQLPNLDTAALAGPLLVSSGDTTVAISPAEHARLLPHLRRVQDDRAPSFDCRRARSAAEREICAPDAGEFRAADLELASLYRLALARDPAVVADQRAWLRERDSCAPDCLWLSYRARKDELIVRLGPPDWARPGAAALFLTPEIWVENSFQTDPLFTRLLPVLMASADSQVTVRVNSDSSIEVNGSAIGGNAHQCDVWGQRLRFDQASGWYSGPFVGQPDDPPEWRRRPMPVVRIAGDHAEIYREGHWNPDSTDDPRPTDYAQCGARAGFSLMVRMPVSAAEARRPIELMRGR